MTRSLLAVVVLILSLAVVRADDKKDKGPDDKPTDAKALAARMAADEKALIELLNKTRAKEKLSILVLNPLLCKAAKQHTENMAKQEKMAHVLDGKGVKDRVIDAGYDYLKVGENLAMASSDDPDVPAPSPADIHKGWLESKKHYANIIDKKYTEVGVSIGRSKKGTYFYTMVFAVPDK